MKTRHSIPKTTLLVLSIFLILTTRAFAQVGINVDSSMADPSAGLDVKFSDKGVLFPRMTLAERDAIVNPANGLIVICTDCVAGGTLSIFLNGIWRIAPVADCNISPPTAGSHIASSTQIIWNWNAVSGATGYKWNSIDDYGTATDIGLVTTKSETGLTCDSSYTRFVWAYSSCNKSSVEVLIQSTAICIPPPGPCPEIPTITYGGQTYNTVQIGSQCWLKENLNIGTWVYGLSSQTNNGIIEKYCYDDIEVNCVNYGGLYKWDEYMNYSASSNSNPSGIQGICPTGWHVPSYSEWSQLTTYLGGTSVAGGKMKKYLTTLWNPPNTGASNSSGFSAVPGGFHFLDYFVNKGVLGCFWTATENSTSSSNNLELANISQMAYYNSYDTIFSLSGRCVKDNCDPPTSPTQGTHTSSQTQIIWNWNTVSGAIGYKWNTVNDFNTATDMGTNTSMTETGLTCNTAYTRYIWAYSSCGPSPAITLTQSTSSCIWACGQPITDSRDSKIYPTVLIGTQCWLAQNLNIGTRIDTTVDQTNNGVIEKYCYDENESNCTTYGGLYLWNEMMNYTTSSNSNPSGVQGICPSDWHLPSQDEWCQLELYLDPTVVCNIYQNFTGTDIGGKLKESGTSHWEPPNTGATNSSQFTALPGGMLEIVPTSMFSGLNAAGLFWSCTEHDGNSIWSRALEFNYSTIWHAAATKNSFAFSVRCIKD